MMKARRVRTTGVRNDARRKRGEEWELKRSKRSRKDAEKHRDTLENEDKDRKHHWKKIGCSRRGGKERIDKREGKMVVKRK